MIWEDDVGEEEERKMALGLAGKIWMERTVNPNAFNEYDKRYLGIETWP